MGNNAYLKRQTDLKQKFLDVGEEMGMQKMWDYVQLALRDPDVMGKDVLGRKRLEKIFEKLKDLSSYYHNAFTDDKEADYITPDLDLVDSLEDTERGNGGFGSTGAF